RRSRRVDDAQHGVTRNRTTEVRHDGTEREGRGQIVNDPEVPTRAGRAPRPAVQRGRRSGGEAPLARREAETIGMATDAAVEHIPLVAEREATRGQPGGHLAQPAAGTRIADRQVEVNRGLHYAR